MHLIETRPWLVIRSLQRTLRRIVAHQVDRALGVRTAWLEPSGGAFGRDYTAEFATRPCGWFTLYRVLHWLDVGPDDVMVDLGSGPGRAVLLASLLPFRRVIGVERDQALHRQAEENLVRFRLRRRAPVELICSDVLDYALPDDVTVVFLYNPFVGTTFREAIMKLLNSLDRAPRRLRIVYVNPQEHDFLMRTGRCRVVATLMNHLRPGREWARMLAAYVYEMGPAFEEAEALGGSSSAKR